MSLSRRTVLRLAGATIAAPMASKLLALAPAPRKLEGHGAFLKLFEKAKKENWKQFEIGDLVGLVGISLIGTPYVGGTLDTDVDTETCLASFTRLDCVTFYEVALGFARTIKLLPLKATAKQAEDLFLAQVETMRYRGGHNTGYLSRLHYVSDYFFDNDRRKVVRLITKYLPGAAAITKPLNFMSTHPNSYLQLKSHPDWVPKLAAMEQEWSARQPVYVPKEVVPMVESLLETGDLIGIATSVVGLDTSHTGICYRDKEGALRLLHASSAHHKVELGPRLSDYLVGFKKDIGIMVARPYEPH